jgi:acyl-CoA dehydrogenase
VIWNQEEAKFRDAPEHLHHRPRHARPDDHGARHRRAEAAYYLRRHGARDRSWCQLFSEPDAGSDLAGLRTSAVKDGDDWVVNGQKIWSTGAHFSDWGMIVTRTDPNAPKHAGLTYFIVDMHAKGVEIRPIKQINGGSGFNEVFFTDVRVPDSNRLGAVGDGWRVRDHDADERARRDRRRRRGGRFRDLLKLARETRRNGRPAIEDSAVRQKLADFYIKSKGLQFTSYRTLSALSRGATPGPRGLDRQGGGRADGPGDGALRPRAAGRDGRPVADEASPQDAASGRRCTSARRACASPAAPTRS